MTPEERKSLKRASNLVYKYDTLLLLLTHFFSNFMIEQYLLFMRYLSTEKGQQIQKFLRLH